MLFLYISFKRRPPGESYEKEISEDAHIEPPMD
jgi:hypothetical protein